MAFRFLIVDDSAAMRAVVHRVLTMTGVEIAGCWEAANGEEALAVLAGQKVDLILTDINMPRMDGEQFVAKLVATEELRGIPVLVVSSAQTEMRAMRMMALGARGFVKKPFLPETLREQLLPLLGVSHAA
ncbi:MAG: response regulator [Bryobacterales bacterium]|nr:response regulator [Bryobacterales bacterium]